MKIKRYSKFLCLILTPLALSLTLLGCHSTDITPTSSRSDDSSQVEHLPEHQELVDRVDRYLEGYGM